MKKNMIFSQNKKHLQISILWEWTYDVGNLHAFFWIALNGCVNFSVCSSSVDVVRECICLSSCFSLSVSSCTFHPRCSLTTSSWCELQGCYGVFFFTIVYSDAIVCASLYPHTPLTHIQFPLSFPSPVEIKISHRPTPKCMWVAWIMDMRLELPLNSSFV